jgi:hypothetical protein
MVAEFWRTKTFKALNDKWYSKLKDSGFVDQEKGLLKKHGGYEKASQLERETRLEYYCRLSHLASNTEFINKFEKLVMLMHSEGFSITEICHEIGDVKHFERDRKIVRYTIRKWQNRWGIKSWSLKQMTWKK